MGNREKGMSRLSKKIKDRIQQTRLFFLDLDGTVYLGKTLIPGAKRFIALLRERGVPYVFLTNNSSLSAKEYLHKITALGIPAALENIFTSGQATALFLKNKMPGARVYVVGTHSFARELASYGLRISSGRGAVDYVVVGYDTELTYGKIRTACEHIDRGAGYIATNPDLVCPVGEGASLPDCGSICYMIEQATGKKPYVIGKPRPAMVELVCRKLSVPPQKAAIIGDRLYTDIAIGRNAGAFTICVLTGESTLADIRRSTIKPDCTISSIDALNPIFK
jgi:4-nitrophenyl phosphatase